MRFGEIYRICKYNYSEINILCNDVLGIFDNYEEGLKSNEILNTNNVRQNLNVVLRRLKVCIDERLGDIKYFNTSSNDLARVIINDNLTLKQKADSAGRIKGKIDCIIQLYESLGQEEQEIGLDIKVPETDDITEFKKYIDGLEFVFTKCPFFQSNDASLKFKSVDIGSTWLIIGVACATIAAGSVLLNNIAAFIDKCIVIKSHKQTYLMQRQQIEKSNRDQKMKEEIIKYVEETYKISVENAIEDLEETTGYQIQDGDERGRVEQSFERLEKLLDKGMQIYTSIDSPPETKALFEPLEMHYLSIAEELKRIEKKSDDEDKK